MGNPKNPGKSKIILSFSKLFLDFGGLSLKFPLCSKIAFFNSTFHLLTASFIKKIFSNSTFRGIYHILKSIEFSSHSAHFGWDQKISVFRLFALYRQVLFLPWICPAYELWKIKFLFWTLCLINLHETRQGECRNKMKPKL